MKRILWLLPVTLVVLFVALAVAGHASRFVGDVITEAARAEIALQGSEARHEAARGYALTTGLAGSVVWAAVMGLAGYVVMRMWRKKRK